MSCAVGYKDDVTQGRVQSKKIGETKYIYQFLTQSLRKEPKTNGSDVKK